MIKLIKTREENSTILYNNIYIHSRYSPVSEAIKYIDAYDDLMSDDIIVIYGLGLGYHVDECIRRSSSKIIVFEINKVLVNICRKNNPSLFYNERVEVISSERSDFYEKFSEYIGRVKDIIIHGPSLETIKESNNELYNNLKWYKRNKENINRNAEMLIKNYESNKEKEHQMIEDLIYELRNINQTFLVLTAGPSLDYEISNIKRYRKEFFIICVGSALRRVVDSEIIPDIFVLIDGQEVVYEQIRGVEELGIPLCFLSTASKKAVSEYKGVKYIFYNEDKGNNIVIDTGKTVGAAALSIATKCNPKSIVLIGQDLALVDGKSHHSHTTKLYEWGEFGDCVRKNIVVKDINGNEILTTETYSYFKIQIEKIINNNSDIMIYNCSKGAFIEGAENISFDEFISKERYIYE
ncbi:6-hydroxymethylpterin diphosphokinase MptE-like protein [uncultured Clostridium sp.]|uniref:motility associated factor glycosyltransferase family protein n=1 Tax=uncultured Clostridium sp. TaxID=59620 RepID=UPI0032176048